MGRNGSEFASADSASRNYDIIVINTAISHHDVPTKKPFCVYSALWRLYGPWKGTRNVYKPSFRSTFCLLHTVSSYGGVEKNNEMNACAIAAPGSKNSLPTMHATLLCGIQTYLFLSLKVCSRSMTILQMVYIYPPPAKPTFLLATPLLSRL
jgi:hypothetical protein